MHYALALLPATHLPTVSLHTQTRPRHTHTHTWACTTCRDFGSYFSHCFHKVYMCMNCTRLCTHTHDTHIHGHTHTHTHMHMHTHRLGLYHLQILGVLISLTVFTKYTCTCLCTHTWTHTHTHTNTHTHTHRLGLYHLQ